MGDRAVTAVVAAVLVAAAVTGGCGGGGRRSSPPTTVAPVPAPAPVTAPETTLTTVAGPPRTTTTLSSALGPGGARLAGTVVGPEGPVPGATVRVERLAGDKVAATTVQSGGDGRWAVDSVNGGRYRLRAWRAPDLAALTPTFVFVVATEAKAVDIGVTRYGEGNALATVSPDPPVVGQPAALVVNVSNGGVDGEGVLRVSPRPGVPVQLAITAGLTLSSPDSVVTDGSGNAGFQVACTGPGPVAAALNFDGAAHPLRLPSCIAA